MNRSELRADKQPELTDAESKLFWEPYAARRWGQYISAIERRAIEFALTQTSEPSQALEIGAEGGRWSQLLANQGWSLICTDIDRDALQVCQSRIPSAKCVLVERDSRHFPCETNTLGMLLAIEVHELVEQDWFVHEASRSLKKNGLFVGVFQNRSSWRALVRNSKRDEGDCIQHYTASYAPWRSRLKELGFEFLRQEGLCWMPFGRMSNSPLIPVSVQIERWLGLRRLPRFSPWIVFVAKKIV